jgi:glycine cleavage system H protein
MEPLEDSAMRSADDKGASRLDGQPVKCVWMEAGAVNFKICDRNLECEGCPFDEAMRQAAGLSGEERTSSSGPWIGGLQFPEDLFYDRHHMWVHVEDRGEMRVGLDALAASLVTGFKRIRLPHPGRRVSTLQTCWSVELSPGRIPFPAPGDGTVLRINEDLLEDPRDLSRDPYGKGWIFALRPDALGSDLQRLTFGRGRGDWFRSELDRCVETWSRMSGHAGVDAPVAADGGAWDPRGVVSMSRRRRLALVGMVLRLRLAPRPTGPERR